MSGSANNPPRPALFLDRDGIINVDHGYVHRREQFEFVPGIFDLTRYAADVGVPVVVVTNQAGIGRGLFDEAAFQDITRWMCERFAAERAPIAKVYHCPYHPEFGLGAYRLDHPWRKPRPGMLLQAAADLGLDLPASAIVGDARATSRRRPRPARAAHPGRTGEGARRRAPTSPRREPGRSAGGAP